MNNSRLRDTAAKRSRCDILPHAVTKRENARIAKVFAGAAWCRCSSRFTRLPVGRLKVTLGGLQSEIVLKDQPNRPQREPRPRAKQNHSVAPVDPSIGNRFGERQRDRGGNAVAP